jgi:hypothetical protein
MSAARIELRYTVRTPEDAWAIPERPVPESIPHNAAVHYLYCVLSFWASRSEKPVFVARNLAIRWLEERPNVGIDPDLCVLDPPPPAVDTLSSLCLWKPGHVAPRVSFEIVSASHPYKDYVAVHERYAAHGALELVVCDPELHGPESLGGPVALQVWRRNELDAFERQYAGPGPVFSHQLGAWISIEGGLPRIAGDRDGAERWPTEAEFERAEAERARAGRLELERELADSELNPTEHRHSALAASPPASLLRLARRRGKR